GRAHHLQGLRQLLRTPRRRPVLAGAAGHRGVRGGLRRVHPRRGLRARRAPHPGPGAAPARPDAGRPRRLGDPRHHRLHRLAVPVRRRLRPGQPRPRPRRLLLDLRPLQRLLPGPSRSGVVLLPVRDGHRLRRDPCRARRGAGARRPRRRLLVADLAVGARPDAPAEPDSRHHPVRHLALQGLQPDLRHDQRRRHRRTEPRAERVRLPAGVRLLAVQPRRRHRRRHAADPARRDAGVPAAAAPTGGGTVTHVSQAREHTVKPVRRFVRRPGRLAAETAALLTAAVVAFPLYWMVLGAFKPAGEIESTEPRPWTLAPTLDSFRRVFGQEDFGRYFLNSVVVAVAVVIASALIAFLAATAVTRFRFRLRTTLLIMFLVAQMVPIEAL